MRFPAALFLLPFLAACGGGGGSTATELPASTLAASQTLSEAQSDALQRQTTQPPESSNDLLYVSNVGNNSITVYHHDSHDNTAPIAVIAGAKTQITSPGQLSQDAHGNIYLANGKSLLVFAHGANGNVAPKRVLAGPLVGILDSIQAMTVDETTGKIFIATNQYPGEGVILRFPAGAGGNTAPFARSALGGAIEEIASDSTGNNLITAGSFGPEIHDYFTQTVVKQFANGTVPQSVYSIGALSSSAIIDDPTTKTFLTRAVGNSSGIVRFAENTVGHGAVTGSNATYTPAIVSTITSDTCGGQMALGFSRNIYVVHAATAGCATDAIYVYEHDSSGNASPLRVLTGPATKLSQPYGIYEGP